MTYSVEPDGRVEDIFHILKPLLLVHRWDTEGSRVNDVAEVIVQGFLKNPYIPLQESPIEFVDEFDLRGLVVC